MVPPPAEDSIIKPSGPAQLITQPARSAFSLKAGEQTILSATVKVQRGDQVLSFKEAGGRLLVLSRSDGWDTVHQTIRIAGIALSEGDCLVVKGSVPESSLVLIESSANFPSPAGDEATARAIWNSLADWLLSLDEEAVALTLKQKPDGSIQFSAIAQEIILGYRPCVSGAVA